VCQRAAGCLHEFSKSYSIKTKDGIGGKSKPSSVDSG
jgi:hypothetical protein